ncbi:CCA tRNA nucleotidyltransferase, mitochondrial [Monascus purpureus]|uniref:CCA tRNA nucleotidyltransferase, mitochondrial n=1 Tax=Monascus purpureus TaxID=5098 RepID=A0A507R272_MONPU|nr:CCA tRNA nucleotidyltransferase, mitochondrial [Monascus purpureus]
MSRLPSLRLLTEGCCHLRILVTHRGSAVRTYSDYRERTKYLTPRRKIFPAPQRTSRLQTIRRIPESMRDREIEDHLPEPLSKRQRTSMTTIEDEKAEAMAHKTKAQIFEGSPQPLASIVLTPIENTLRTLLLDVAYYIREQEIVAGGAEVVGHPETVLRFTGGWVRDKLLGVDSHDIDVGINTMTGYQFGMALKQYLDNPQNLEKYRKNHTNGVLRDEIVSLHKIEANPEKSKHLETVTTKIFGLDVDLVNLRKETYSEDSRNPQMEFGTAVEDALRRDATVNALFYNLNESKLEDLTGRGLEDMKNKLIRTPLEPYQTFKDDPLRVLRLIRFASRLGYRIDENTVKAMQNRDISAALKLKISKERVGAEIEKMLRGPDPRGALHIIDRLGLYPTVFANHQDSVSVDTSSWSLAYDSLEKLLHAKAGDKENSGAVVEHVRNKLIRNADEAYYAWVIAMFAPWTTVPGRIAKGPKAKPLPPRAAEVARDSLRSDNRTTTLLSIASNNFEDIISIKSSLLDNSISGISAEVRQKIGLRIRSWKKDYRLCMVLAILQEIMRGENFLQVLQTYDKFLAYMVKNDLEDVNEMKPIVNGSEISEALGVKSGPWMSKALDIVIKWQLLHPDITEKEKALQELSSRRAELGLTPKE